MLSPADAVTVTMLPLCTRDQSELLLVNLNRIGQAKYHEQIGLRANSLIPHLGQRRSKRQPSISAYTRVAVASPQRFILSRIDGLQ